MNWDKFTIETTTEAEEFIAAVLCELGIDGIEIEDNRPLSEEESSKMFIDFPPEMPEDDGTSRVSFYLEGGKDHTRTLAAVAEGIEEVREYAPVGSGRIINSKTQESDWLNNWKEFFHTFYIDNIVIKPTWEELEQQDKDKILIEIDPGSSFGTGKHETTQLCIKELQTYIKPDMEVLDVGCGSGILSIAALKLGAKHVTGTDIDENCMISTFENFAVNHLEPDTGSFYVGNLIDDEELQKTVGTGCYDVVAANILADVIIPMAPALRNTMKEDGILITSGIIDFKEEEVKAALVAAGLEIVSVGHQGEWVGITCRIAK